MGKRQLKKFGNGIQEEGRGERKWEISRQEETIPMIFGAGGPQILYPTHISLQSSSKLQHHASLPMGIYHIGCVLNLPESPPSRE